MATVWAQPQLSTTAQQEPLMPSPELAERVNSIFDQLTPRGRERFRRELMAGLEASTTDNPRPFLRVLEAWYRTMLIRQHPLYQERVLADIEPSEPTLTPAQVKAQLQL